MRSKMVEFSPNTTVQGSNQLFTKVSPLAMEKGLSMVFANKYNMPGKVLCNRNFRTEQDHLKFVLLNCTKTKAIDAHYGGYSKQFYSLPKPVDVMEDRDTVDVEESSMEGCPNSQGPCIVN